MRSRKLKNNARTRKYLESLPNLYAIRCSVTQYEYAEFKSFGETDDRGFPLVWTYYDGNGTTDEWRLTPIDKSTIGPVLAWAINEKAAKFIVQALNNKYFGG